jgi:Xaa-Pro aminopeptidase
MQAALLQNRRDRIARAWDLARGAVLIPAGLPVPRPGNDQFHDFHAHAEHYYLSGVATPGAVLTFDAAEGWTLFAPVPSEDDRIWSGDGVGLDQLTAEAALGRVLPIARLDGWVEKRRAEPIALLGNHDLEARHREYGLGNWSSLELAIDEALSTRLSDHVAEARRAKDADEVELMRAAAVASGAGHLTGMRLARAGMHERRLQVEIEADFFRAGSARTAYSSIVGSGANAGILHIQPSQRALADGDLVLVDAAAEMAGYAADVTRVYPVAARFSGVQRDLYQLVLKTQENAIAGVRPGVEFRELHLAAAYSIAEGLVSLGILRGDPATLVERDAHALFFPHGLGHMLGLATHDVSGCLAGREKSDRFGLKWLRTDLPLQPGYVVTIEPGIYFIPAILNDPARRKRYADAVDWARVDSLLSFGGIRIEDDVLVTETGSDVLSGAIPKSIAAIEAIRAEALGA